MAFLISLAQFIFNLSTAMKGNPGEKREGCQTSRYGTIAISQTDGIKKHIIEMNSSCLKLFSPPCVKPHSCSSCPTPCFGLLGTAHFERCLILRRFFCSRRVRFLEKMSDCQVLQKCPTNINKPWAVGRKPRQAASSTSSGTWIAPDMQET